MAYTPISQTKKTGGYVPIGTKSDKPSSTEVFRGAFPFKNMVQQATFNIAQKAATTPVLSPTKPTTISQGEAEKPNLIRQAIRAIPGDSRFEKSLERDFYEPIAKVGRFLFPTTEDIMRQVANEKPGLSKEQFNKEVEKRVTSSGLPLNRPGEPITSDTKIFSPDVVGMIKKVPSKIAQRFIGAKTEQEAAQLASEIGLRTDKNVISKIVGLSDETQVQNFIDDLKKQGSIPKTEPLPELPKVSQPPKTIPDRVVQIADTKSGEVKMYRIPEKDFDEVKYLIDDGRTADTPIAMGQKTGDVVYHITAKTPEQMLAREGVIDAGTITAKELRDVSQKFVTPTTPDPRNFKTADEFVAAQGNPVYRAGEKGNFFSDSSDYVQQGKFPGKVNEVVLPPQAKIFDASKGTVELNKLANKQELAILNNKPTDTQLRSVWNTILEREGYDGMKFMDEFADGSKAAQTTFVTDSAKANLKTKSQLTDIWNQAQKTTPVTVETTTKLPALPKLSPEIKRAIETNQANKTINDAIRTRYSNAARRPVKEDSAMAAAAKKPGNVEGIKKLTGELLTPISSRLMRINPKLKRELRAFEFRVANNTTQNSQEVLPLLQATKKMSKDDQAIFDLARKNGDSEVIDALATKYDIHDELNRTRDVLDDIHRRGKEVGMFGDDAYRKDYFPRMVTNPEKFMAYLRGTEDWGLIQRMLDNAATKKGLRVTDLTPEEQASLVNNFIRGYGDKVTLAKPGFTQARSINVIDDNLNQFYESTDSALSAYVVRMNDEIEGRKFFGKHSKENIGDARIEDSIGSYVLDLAAKGEIKPDQITEVSDIFKSRFHRGKMNGALDVYRNAEYLSTMGSPISAITQIGDLAFSLYNNGFYNTLKGAGKSVFSKNKLSKEALGIENITQEFTKNSMSGKALDRIFKITGMNWMDRLGKETLVNGYLSKLKSQAKNGDEVLKRELDFMFDSEESALAMKELAEGKLTDRTKLLAFNKLLDFQPVAKSEMPQKYLEMPNGRIFYMLKSFTLKQIDVFRREAIDDITSGNAKQAAKGAKNLLLLSGAFVAANATADEVKDLILGRETSPSDKLVDNLWRLVGASKYDVYKARTDGVGQTVVKKILFPTSLADNFYKDVTNQLEGKEYEKGLLKGEAYKLESTASIPVGGKLYYWWMGRGAQKEEYEQGSTTETGLPALPKIPSGTTPELPKLPKLPKQ